MTSEEIKAKAQKYVLQSWSKQKNTNPMPIEKAEGIYFYDYDGNRYTDMSSQLVNLNLGFGNKAIEHAINEQASKYCYLSPALGCEARSELAELIVTHLPQEFGKIFFTNAGADANENAIHQCDLEDLLLICLAFYTVLISNVLSCLLSRQHHHKNILCLHLLLVLHRASVQPHAADMRIARTTTNCIRLLFLCYKQLS